MTQFKRCRFIIWIGLFFALDLEAQTLKLMTYNIRLDVASDAENAWPLRRSFLVDQLHFFEPDILGVQEALPNQVQFLETNLPDYGREGLGREGSGKGEFSAVFYKRSRFLLLKSQTFWLSPTPDTVSIGWDAACLRVCTAVLLKDKHTKQKFWVFNTHLDHIGEAARKGGLELILSRIKSMNPEQLPVVFMGDLNATPETSLIALVKSQLDDTREKSAVAPLGPEGSFTGFKFGAAKLRLIDYIFINRNPKIKVKKYAVVEHSRNQLYPSDHFPVYVEIELLK